ncbi:MAG TPA: glucose-6-phosphate isomerase, partial [Bacteroidetes bacterium]|nr:glucose-6-phosphate isomerase [Bacteroidota bacterium]
MAVELSLEGLGNYRQDVETALAELDEQRVVERIWQHDHTLWKPDPKEIANRLGWLEIADEMQARLGELQAFADEVREAGYSNVLLLGMGGSSLAPEVFRKVFGVRPGYLDLAVLDSTDPGAVKGWTDRLDPKRTLFLVSTKSGTTVETLSFFKFFYTWTVQALGRQGAGEHFVAITDPGSPLVATAEKHGFRRIFLNNPNIGGRYSALSYFGLVPAALVGADLEALLERARQAMTDCGPSVPAPQNPAAQLGVVLGQLTLCGRDKLTFVAPPEIAPFGDWLEQLVAESTGKEGKGILPVVGEPPGEPGVYGDDRVFAVASLPQQTEVAPSLDSL